MLLMLSVHPCRRSDLLSEDRIDFSPKVQNRDFKDAFGNICPRLIAPPASLEVRSEFIIADSGKPDGVAPGLPSNGPLRLYPTTYSCICSAAGTATRKNCLTMPGPCLVTSMAVGRGRTPYANTFTTALSSDISMRETTEPHGKGMKSALEYVGISPTSR
jgi:hypothetical protein